jgi:signal transduction histidine kinase
LQKKNVLEFLNSGGQMGARMRTFDWQKTVLGAPEAWPQSLKTIVRVMLDSRFAMWMSWGAAGTFFCNDAYLPTLGLKQEWALGSRSDKVWEEIWHDIGPRIHHVLSTGVATWDEGLLLFLRRSGYQEETYHTFSYSPAYDDDSQVAGMLCVVAEDTERVIGERRLGLLRALAASPTLQAASVEEAGIAVLESLAGDTLDVPFAGLYLYPVERSPRLLQATTAGGTAIERSPDFDVRLFEAALAASRENAVLQLSDLEVRIIGPWHEPLREALVFPLNAQGQLQQLGLLVLGVSTRRQLDDGYRSFLGLVADQFASKLGDAQTSLAAQMRADSLAELDRAKNLFFSNASHELRTPLTLLLGPIEHLLARRDMPHEALDELRLARRNGERLRKLVNSLLDFSRIEAGRMKANHQRTDLAALTTDLASVFRAAIEHAGLRLNVRCDPESLIAFVDPEMWEKVVLNLLSNALKFTFEGGIDLELIASGVEARLTVRDSGVGIDDAELSRIFERFHRVPGARSRSQEGTGIGLALVKELVRLHGGEVAVTSRKGSGSTFIVTLPLRGESARDLSEDAKLDRTAVDRYSYLEDALRADASLDAGVHATPAAVVDGHAGAAHILVVDDNADMRAYIRRLLSPYWTVTTAGDGAQALQRLSEDPPDLVLTDMMMPNIDGAGLLERIRGNEATRSLPVIVLSAQAGEEARVAGLQQGADDYLVKPFVAAELVARIEVQLMRQTLRRAEDLSNKRLADVFRSAPVGVALLKGPDHVYEFANAVHQEMVGPRALLGRPFREVMPELDGQGIFELLDEVYATGKPYNGHAREVRMKNPTTGHLEQRFFEFVYQPLLDDGRDARGIAIVGIDVSELMQARMAAEAASRTKDEFIAMLGHELRNPLAPISTALQLMKLRLGDVAAKERAVIDRQVKHLSRLVDDMLDVSRVARGTMELRREMVELSAIVDKALETAEPLFEKMHQTVSVDVPRDGLVVFADPVRLCQVIANLMTNAAKFGGTDGLIRIAAAAGEDEVALTVTDHGAGMTREELDSVFDMFVQGRQGMHRPQGGLGLGLTIARNLARLHEGSLGASSEGPGMGSVFTLRLPLHAAQQIRHDVHNLAPVQAIGPRRRVLVVDDIEDVALSMRDLLSDLGHEVIVAFDGPSALSQVAASGPIDVALLDIGLPVMDGYELAVQLRKSQGSSPLRLVALSGFGQASDREKSRAYGFDLHLIKPVEIDDLVEAISRCS